LSGLVQCEKSEPNDPATKAAGTYSGDYKYSDYDEVFPANVTLTRINDTIVKLSAVVDGHHVYDKNVTVKEKEGGNLDLYSYNDTWWNWLGGEIVNNTLTYTYTMNLETFRGSKP
jgi:hypothetical protein